MKIPFFRTSDGSVLAFFPNDESSLNALRRLAIDHQFQVAQSHNVIIIEQGFAWGAKTPHRPHGFGYEYNALMAGGTDDALSVCEACPREWKHCGGLDSSGPVVRIGSRNGAGISGMSEAIRDAGNCGLYKEYTGDELSIQRRHIRDLGFEPVSSIRAFVDFEDLDENDLRLLKAADFTSLETLNATLDTRSYVNRGWGIPDGAYTKKPRATTIGDIMFDPVIVGANILAQKVKGMHSQESKKKIGDYRKANCSRCVYDCERPPWNLDNPRPLTHEQILTQFVPNAHSRQWMALHSICGVPGKFRNDVYRGHMRDGFGDRPVYADGEWRIRVRSRRPGYEELCELSVHDYWSAAHSDGHDDLKNKYQYSLPKLTTEDPEKLAYANWALTQITDISRWGELKFHVNGHMSRNDVVGLWMDSGCENITIHSDTLATTTGGMNEKGSTIDVDDRPRFRTDYSTPFAEAIREWTRQTPGACCV